MLSYTELASQFNDLVNKLKQLVIDRKLVNITVDSRQADANTIFVALRGNKVDAKAFIPQAVAQGCSVVLTYQAEPTDILAVHTQEEIEGKTIDIFAIYDIEKYLSFISLKFFDFLTTSYTQEIGLDTPVIGITGTNGKTLTTNLICQGLQAYNPNQSVYLMGTLGYGPYGNLYKTSNTTPEACTVMREIFHAKVNDAQAMVMEVSSHGLALNRVKNVRFTQAIFTNLTQDHLDFHHTFEEYFKAKSLFFTTHNVQDFIITCNGKSGDYGAKLVNLVKMKMATQEDGSEHARGTPASLSSMLAVQGALPDPTHLAGANNARPNPLGESLRFLNTTYLDDLESKVLKAGRKSRLAVVNIGETVDKRVSYTADIVVTLTKLQPHPQGINVSFTFEDKLAKVNTEFTISSKLFGTFNAYNLLTAFTSLYMYGCPLEFCEKILPTLQSVNGRMQLVPNTQQKTVLVDFAHTPDALEKAITSSKEHFNETNGKVWVVFGCGGDRDATKRPIMGEIACRLADYVIVTDDNPRSEDPHTIANDILAGCPEPMISAGKCYYVNDRRKALEEVIKASQAGDLVIVAGKGHETTQIIKDQELFFSDFQALQEILA